MCSTMICRSPQHCGVAEFTCAHICIRPLFELPSLFPSPSLHLYFHSFDQSSDHPHFHLLYLLSAVPSVLSFDLFHIQSCICLLSFSLLFCPSVCNLISRAPLLSVPCFICTLKCGPSTLTLLIFLSQIVHQVRFCSTKFHLLLNQRCDHCRYSIMKYLSCNGTVTKSAD